VISYFFDSSALVKVYASEPGSQVAQALFYSPGHRIYTSWLSLAEVPSAIYRKAQASLARTSADVIMIRFMADYETHCHELRFSNNHFLLAFDLIKRHSLTAADALILAQTLRLSKRVRRLIFVASDQRLLAAAKSEGLATTDPAQLKQIP
jgi:predicted nucleic acid-binding protein